MKSLYYVNGSMRGSRRNKIHPRGNPAIVRSIPQYSHNIHTHTRRKPVGFPPSPSPCTPLAKKITKTGNIYWKMEIQAIHNTNTLSYQCTACTFKNIIICHCAHLITMPLAISLIMPMLQSSTSNTNMTTRSLVGSGTNNSDQQLQ